MATMAASVIITKCSASSAPPPTARSRRRIASWPIKYHPDKNPGDQEAIDRFKEAAEAFEVLNDSDKRGRYDRYGHAGLNGQRRRPPLHRRRRHLLRVRRFVRRPVRRPAAQSARSKGRDVRCDVTLTLHEAAARRHQDGRVPTPRTLRRRAKAPAPPPAAAARVCSYCRGQGRVIQSAGIVRMQTTCPALPRRRLDRSSIPARAAAAAARCSRRSRPKSQIPRRRRRRDARPHHRRRRAEPQRRPARRLLLLHLRAARIRSSSATASTWSAACRSPTPRPRSARRSKCPRSKAAAKSKIPAGTQSGAVFKHGRQRHARPAPPRPGRFARAGIDRSAQKAQQRGTNFAP